MKYTATVLFSSQVTEDHWEVVSMTIPCEHSTPVGDLVDTYRSRIGKGCGWVRLCITENTEIADPGKEVKK